jgi:FAD/FMN-containing dehydrogenase
MQFVIPCWRWQFAHSYQSSYHKKQSWKRRNDQCIKSIVQIGKKFRGTVSGEHGVGLIQKPYMDIVFNNANLQLMRAIKKAFDPNNILNAGKIFDLN